MRGASKSQSLKARICKNKMLLKSPFLSPTAPPPAPAPHHEGQNCKIEGGCWVFPLPGSLSGEWLWARLHLNVQREGRGVEARGQARPGTGAPGCVLRPAVGKTPSPPLLPTSSVRLLLAGFPEPRAAHPFPFTLPWLLWKQGCH